MAHQGQLLTKSILLIVVFISSCAQSDTDTYITVNSSDHILKTHLGIMHVNHKPFTGKIFQLYPNSRDTSYIKYYIGGKEDGEWSYYYRNHSIKETRSFYKGVKKGDHIGFWPNGKMRFQYQLHDDVYHGFKKEWSAEGKLISEMNYKNGQEEGSQKLWYSNGKIKSNYIIKKGRRYGLLGTKNCVNVTDSIFTM